MHWQIEEDDITQFVVPENVVDLLFSIECKSLPVDHAFALSAAIQKALPWFADDDIAALHMIHGAQSGNGWERPEGEGDIIYLSRRTKLALRVPAERIDNAIKELRQAISGKDTEKIKTKSETLSKVLQEIGTAAYQQAASARPSQQGEQASQTSEPKSDDEKVVDADYTVVDEDKE